jgi:ABC-2 type transport system ATP-binding protein
MEQNAEAARNEPSTPSGRGSSDRTAAIQVRNLSKYYGEFLAVDNISFDVREGEILGFLGPNGAGKTTTIRIITCFMPASSGQIRVAGHDVFTDSIRVRQQIGYMPENVPQYPEMRVREYLRFRAAIKGVPRQDRSRRIADVVDRCGIASVESKIIGQLSKGFRQRVGMADALVSDPKILVLDEPMASLDPNQQALAKKLIQELKGRHTIIFSSHILSDVEEIADRMVIIDKGAVVGEGTPDEFAKRFQDENHFRLEVVGPKSEVEQAMKSLPGVRDVVATDRNGSVILKVRSEANADIREQLSKAVVSRNWALREITFERIELAKIFARLTAGSSESGR